MQQRALRADDITEWTALLDACAAADDTGEYYGPEDLAERLDAPGLDLERDTLAVLREGRLAGCATLGLRTTDDPVISFSLDAQVHPRDRGHGIGSALIRWALATAERRQAAEGAGRPLTVRTGLPEPDQAGAALLTRFGFAPVRWFSELTLDLAATTPASLPEPAGLILRPYRDEDEEPLRRLRNAAFADHWSAGLRTVEQWRHLQTGARSFRPDLSWVALDDDGTRAGMALTHYYEADTTATGIKDAYIDTVATAAAYRRRGVASALIRHVAATADGLGFRTASLGVDTASPTGADSLYHSLGFGSARTFVIYDFPAADPTDPAGP